MRGAEASTDHRLVRSILRLKIRPITRRRNLSPKINLAALQNSNAREAFQQAVTDSLPPARQPTGDSNITTESLTTSWNNVYATLLQTAKAVLGSTNRRHRDWFDENAENIHDLITAKNKAHDLYLRNPSPTTRNQFSAVRSELQRLLRDMENKWWTNLAAQMQSYMDLGDLHNFYSSLKTAYGPAYSALTPVRSADGIHLLTDSTQILDRWASHFRQLLNHSNPTNPSFLSEVPQLPVSHELDSVPTIEEVIKSIAALKNHKAAGPDNIPAELLKYGGIEIATQLQQLFQSLHDGTNAVVVAGGRRSDPFEVSTGVKQGCVLAPILFNLFAAVVTQVFYANNDATGLGITINYRLDGNLFNNARMRAKTRTSTISVIELQYADDAAFVSHTQQGLKSTLDGIVDSYTRVGLVVNTNKTEVLYQRTGHNAPVDDPNIEIDGNALKITNTSPAEKSVGEARIKIFYRKIVSTHSKADEEALRKITYRNMSENKNKDMTSLKMPTTLSTC
ncbi:uncharacterized protein LOC143026750 [Oratosquilla oratoria]|uniref:uncharacterized protein LOC143026750 n=1 Tax=Oratosquilla oratoria TaxID=337810 RepID=UPI003F773306